MKKTVLAALLFAPGLAAAACFPHPETGRILCEYAHECPQGTTWTPRQVCEPNTSTTAVATCTGVDAGTYTPQPVWTSNLVHASGRESHWTRIGPVVSVAGALGLVAERAGWVQVYLPPPIPTQFTSHFQAAGVMTSTSGDSSHVTSVPDTQEVRLEYLGPGALVNDNVRYTYAYRISECP